MSDPKRDISDLLDAWSDYFEARMAEHKAAEEHEAGGMYDWDWFGRSYIDAVDRARERVQVEFERVFDV